MGLKGIKKQAQWLGEARQRNGAKAMGKIANMVK